MHDISKDTLPGPKSKVLVCPFRKSENTIYGIEMEKINEIKLKQRKLLESATNKMSDNPTSAKKKKKHQIHHNQDE